MDAKVQNIVLVLLCLLFTCTKADTASFRNQGLDEIPWSQVGPTVDTLDVRENQLYDAGTVPMGLPIVIIRLQDNPMTAFPNFLNVSSTLQELFLALNPITSISPPTLLSGLTELLKLVMRATHLVSIPEVRYIPPKLHLFAFADTFLTELPNMCYLPGSQRQGGAMTTGLARVKFRCDDNMVWTKLAYDAGLLTIVQGNRNLTFPECLGHPALNATPWQQIDLQDFLRRDEDVHDNYFENLGDPNNFYCYPHITKIVDNTSLVDCGSHCLKMATCTMFAKEGGRCILSEFRSGSFGSRDEFLAYNNWFLIK